MKISHPLRLLIAAASVAGASYHPSTLAHGYMDFPPARQTICANDGGYWGAPDGSQIPNAACRAAFLESGWYPFVQQPEFARLVSDYRNQSAVESAIPDGSLCAAADGKKSGVDLPSPAWQALLLVWITTASLPFATGQKPHITPASGSFTSANPASTRQRKY